MLDLVDLRPYTSLQTLIDATVPHGWHYYWKTANFTALADDLIDTTCEHAARNRWTWPYVVLFHLGGAISDVGCRHGLQSTARGAQPQHQRRVAAGPA